MTESSCQHCPRESESRGLCKSHLLRDRLGGVAVGDDIWINGYGPFTVRRKTEKANSRGQYTDTFLRLVGHRNEDKRELWRVRLWFNDSGKRGAGRPGWHTIDEDGGRASGSNSLHTLSFDDEPGPESIVAEQTATDLIDGVD